MSALSQAANLPVASHEAATSSSSSAHQLIDAFLAGRNTRTLRAYRADLDDFAAFVRAPDLDAAAQAPLARDLGTANAVALSYRAHLVERGLAAATVNRRLAALRSLVKLARTLGLVPFELEVPNVKAESYRDTKGPVRIGFVRTLATVKAREDSKGARDTAILRLLYDVALRRAEVVALDLADLDLAAGTLAVLGKGRTSKTKLTLPEPTKLALSAWISIRGSEAGPLFTNLDRAAKGTTCGRRLDAGSVYRIVRSLGEGVGVRARPHGLRHAGITEALDVTRGDVRAVQRFSRHRSLGVLLAYDDCRRDLGGEVARMVAEGASDAHGHVRPMPQSVTTAPANGR